MKNEFIAWDEGNKRFIPPSSVAIDGEGVVFLCDGSLVIDGCATEVEDIKLLEYSGKHDRTGVKLYKGDIVKAVLLECADKFDDFDLCKKEIIGVVTIQPSAGAKLIVKKVFPKHALGIVKDGTLHIDQTSDIRIGNIYTNPELIEEDSEAKEE